jgi:hypothetical protein
VEVEDLHGESLRSGDGERTPACASVRECPLVAAGREATLSVVANRSEHFYAVVRVDLYDGVTLDEIREHATNYVTVKEVLPTQEEAEREVERLTALNADKQCVYFAQVTQFFRDGRDVQVGY